MDKTYTRAVKEIPKYKNCPLKMCTTTPLSTIVEMNLHTKDYQNTQKLNIKAKAFTKHTNI